MTEKRKKINLAGKNIALQGQLAATVTRPEKVSLNALAFYVRGFHSHLLITYIHYTNSLEIKQAFIVLPSSIYKLCQKHNYNYNCESGNINI